MPPLAAAGWYDDGPVDLGGQFPCLEAGSALCTVLPTIELGELVPLLEAALAPLKLNPITLPMLLALSEFEARPELVLPLLPEFLQGDAIAVGTLVRAACLASLAGAAAEAKQLLRRQIMPRVHRINAYHVETLGLIVAIDPICGLQALRATRPRDIASDEEEFGGRRPLFAEAYRTVNRAAKAKRLAESETATD